MQKRRRNIFPVPAIAPFLVPVALRVKSAARPRIQVPKTPRFELSQPRLVKPVSAN